MIENGEYQTKAELIREAIQKLIDWELHIPSIKSLKWTAPTQNTGISGNII